MQTARTYRELHAWKKGMALVKETYVVTRNLPDEERYGLVSQMRRCAVSIPSNIAEGAGRDSGPDFLRFLFMARASGHELSTQAEICTELGYGDEFQKVVSLSEEVGRIINGLIASIKRPAQSNRPVQHPAN